MLVDSRTMMYEDGVVIEGSFHPQVDSGFGFTCDEEILPFIIAFYSVGMRTLGSCQSIPAWSPSVTVSSTFLSLPMSFPRRWVAYTHDDLQTVFDFAIHVRNKLLEPGGDWTQLIEIDRYSSPDMVFATLEFTPNLDEKVLAMIKMWGA
jgi:hypothetical protein